ncbi:MAG TPA: thioredoxin [Steroidobacteraceae bacterium]
MSTSVKKIVATAQNFMSEVVEASNQVPVLVDFWAPWCGPCKSLMPLLDRLADDYGGRFILAKVNTDEEQQLATHFQIRSIPMVVLIHRGEVVDQFVGAQPESEVRAFLDRHLAGVEGSPPPDAAVAGQPEAAPDRPEVLASRLLDQRDADGAAAAIETLAAANAAHPLVQPLRARLAIVQLANANPDVQALREALARDPANSAARHALAAHHALAWDFDTALAHWLELMQRDRLFGDEAGRRFLLLAFDVLGDQDPLVAQYRRRMASLLH